jgi:hypothetical protein
VPPPARALACFALLLLAPGMAVASLPDALSLSGYARENPILWESAPVPTGSDPLFVNLLHLRQNLRWYPSSSLTVALETKERLFLGDSAGDLADAISLQGARGPYFDWTASTHGNASYAEAAVDRFWIDFTSGSLEIRAGRQRIAWGTNLVWNPVDVFNPSAFLDFDNEEKPGTDAARVQYYLGPASEVDVAWAPGRNSAETDAAARIKVNQWGYDLTLIAGRRADDEVAGLAWASSIGGAGIRGEALLGRPRKGQDDDGYANASVSGDFAFPNTVYVQASALYESRGTMGDAGGLELISSYERGDLSPGRWSLFGEISKDLTPLWHGDVSAIVNPSDGSLYVGPTLTWSAAPDLDLTAAALLFAGRAGTEFGDEGRIWMLRAKYSF